MDIAFVNNQSWIWSLGLIDWALIYDLPSASFDMQMRDSDLSNIIVYEWKTGGVEQGRIDYEPTSKILTITAPYADMKAIRAKTYKYDLQMSAPASNPTQVKLFARGDVAILQGVTR